MKIGIVTLSFNQGRFLEQALASVQVSPRHELMYVAVDPGSTDGSRDILARQSGKFARVILEPDQGPADGLNKGFAACDAAVFGYLNADDRFAPGALDFVADYFEQHPEIDLLQGAIRIIDESGRRKLRGRAPDRLRPERLACGAAYAWQQATFFRRELFERAGGFAVDNRVTWDGELVLNMLLRGARVGYTRVVLGEFRIHAESITGSGQGARQERASWRRLRERLEQAGGRPLPRWRESAARLAYKFNLLRHLRSLLHTQAPTVMIR